MKLKIPIYENEEKRNKIIGYDDDLDVNDQKKIIQSKERVCEVCNKVFGSGKALGGHMRIHFQAYKNIVMKEKMSAQQSTKFKKLKKSSKSDGFDQIGSFKKGKKRSSLDQFGSSSVDDEPTCALCFKVFPSMKSLFGHMRCHPEREWRGIHPPPPPSTSPSPSPLLHAKCSSVSWSANLSNGELNDDDLGPEKAVFEAGELLEVFPKWSVTGKRGRKAVKMVEYDDVEEEVLEAVDDLMMLAKGVGDSCDYLSSDLTQKHPKGGSYEVTNSNSLSNNNNKTIEFIVGKIVVESDDEFGSNESSLVGKKGMINIKNKKERKKMKLRDLDQIQDSFPLSFNHTLPLAIAAEAAPLGTTISPEKHKCSICGKSFPIHQALGGHKSSHNKFRMFIQNSIDDDQYHSPSSAQSISAQDEVVSHTLDFDLNELPQLE